MVFGESNQTVRKWQLAPYCEPNFYSQTILKWQLASSVAHADLNVESQGRNRECINMRRILVGKDRL
jgi:hypothetical protein